MNKKTMPNLPPSKSAPPEDMSTVLNAPPDTARRRKAKDHGPSGSGVAAAPTAAPPAVTKQETILALLRRPLGADIAEMMQATGWMAHSVRGMLSAVIKRKLGLELISEPGPERGRIYRIAAPTRSIPVGLTTRKRRSHTAARDVGDSRASA